MEVETRAADEACRILRREGRRLGKGRNKVQEKVEEGGDGDGNGDGAAAGDNVDMVCEEEVEPGAGRKRKINDDDDLDDAVDEWLSAKN